MAVGDDPSQAGVDGPGSAFASLQGVYGKGAAVCAQEKTSLSVNNIPRLCTIDPHKPRFTSDQVMRRLLFLILPE